MTGYAVTFNKRHKRSGHLFQNRYKSIVCEEDPYLLELIRYIHLNPLRAGLVEDLKQLDRYPWTGHSTILGRRKNPLIPDLPIRRNRLNRPDKSLAEKTVEDVLLFFGDTLKVARRRYRQFVKNGIDQGTRPDLQGGGLVRSAGGDKTGLLGRKKDEREKGDVRILGSGKFVAKVIKEIEGKDEKVASSLIALPDLIHNVTEQIGMSKEALVSKSRDQAVSSARAIICFLAAKKLGYTQSEIKSHLKISRIGVRNCIIRGEKMIDKCEEIWEKLI